MTAARRRLLLRTGLYALVLVAATLARATLPSFYEFESQEDTVRALAILEQGNIPLYGIGHIRFLGAALGPLVYYLKLLPYLFSSDPAGEVLYLFLLHLAALIFAMLLARDIFAAWFAAVWGPRPAERFDWPVELAAAGTGLLAALSLHANGLTSHAHPSYFAATFMVPFVWAVHRTCTRGGRAAPLVAGVTFGVMTQLYQLTLFAPFLAAAMALALGYRPRRRDLALFLVPLFICYLPYLLSELLTGFWNTANLFSFQPGPQDAAMVESPALHNLHYLVNIAIEHIFIPIHADLLFLVALAVGLPAIGIRSLRIPALRTPLLLVLFYGLATALFLGAPRFQLLLPGLQVVTVLGLLELGRLARRALARFPRNVTIPALTAGLLALLVASWLLGSSNPGIALRRPLFYPMRMVSSRPIGDFPTLAESRELVRHARTRYGLSVETLSEVVHSPILASGFYGHHYLMRVAEEQLPTPPLRTAAPLFVVDDRFPYRVAGLESSRVGRHEFHRLSATRLPRHSFRRTISCDHDWCRERAAPTAQEPRIPFFWGCGEFRDLESRLGIAGEDCEELLLAPEHRRTYEGLLCLPPPPAACTDCREVLYLAAHSACNTVLLLDGRSIPLAWQHGHERDYALVELPPEFPRETHLTLTLSDCVPYSLDLVSFTGVPRPVSDRHDP